MSDENGGKETRRFRSPPYPAIPLSKAVERAEQVFRKAQHHAVGAGVLADAWGMSETSGSLWKTGAALLQYGLMTDQGTGKARKFQLTDISRRIIQDANPSSEKRKSALKTAALQPTIHKELWQQFNNPVSLSDAVLKNHLTLDRAEGGEAPYSIAAADDVIRTYRDAITFAGLQSSSAIAPPEDDKPNELTGGGSSSERQKVKIGDYVQWISAGVEQFKNPRQVSWVSEDDAFVRVFGSPTGIAMDEVAAAKPPVVRAASPSTGTGESQEKSQSLPGSASDINVYQIGGRLQITADVDVQGIKKLKLMLDKYEEILALLDTNDIAAN